MKYPTIKEMRAAFPDFFDKDALKKHHYTGLTKKRGDYMILTKITPPPAGRGGRSTVDYDVYHFTDEVIFVGTSKRMGQAEKIITAANKIQKKEIKAPQLDDKKDK